MSSAWPTSFDDFTTTHAGGDPKTGHASVHNKIGDAIEKMQAELGLNPSGAYASIAAAITALAAGGSGSGQLYPNGVTDYGMSTGAANNATTMQTMIDELTVAGHGCVCYVPRGIYNFTDDVFIGDKYGVTIITDPIVSFNEGGQLGTVFRANTAGMTLFNGVCSGLFHPGPQFLGNPHFYANANNVKLVDLSDVNHWFFERPNFGHGPGITGTTMLRINTVIPGGDNAYGTLLHPSFTSENGAAGTGTIGIHAVATLGFQVFAGNFNMGVGGYGVKLYNCSEAKFFGTKWNHAGRHVYCEGASNEWHGCAFETFDASGVEWALEFVRPASPTGPQGRSNKVIGGQITGNTGNEKGIKVTDLDPNPNVWNAPSYNVFTPSFVNLATAYQDYAASGTYNVWGDTQYAPSIPDKSAIELDTPAEVAAVINSMLAAMRRSGVSV